MPPESYRTVKPMTIGMFCIVINEDLEELVDSRHKAPRKFVGLNTNAIIVLSSITDSISNYNAHTP